jgi:hypothetical protein
MIKKTISKVETPLWCKVSSCALSRVFMTFFCFPMPWCVLNVCNMYNYNNHSHIFVALRIGKFFIFLLVCYLECNFNVVRLLFLGCVIWCLEFVVMTSNVRFSRTIVGRGIKDQKQIIGIKVLKFLELFLTSNEVSWILQLWKRWLNKETHTIELDFCAPMPSNLCFLCVKNGWF